MHAVYLPMELAPPAGSIRTNVLRLVPHLRLMSLLATDILYVSLMFLRLLVEY